MSAAPVADRAAPPDAGAPVPLPRLHAALHARFEAPLGGSHAGLRERLAWLNGETLSQLRLVLRRHRGARALHFLCSTTLSKLFSSRHEHVGGLLRRVERETGVRSMGLVHCHQCTGWGFALRAVAGNTAARWVVLSIVDADLHDFWGPSMEPVIGRMGYGVTTLCLEIAPGVELPRCEGPFANHGYTDLLRAVRALHRAHGPLPTFLPFMPADLAAVAERAVGGPALGPNRHAHYGHAFGADPWIGLIEWKLAQRQQRVAAADSTAASTVALGAFAYEGYFTLARIEVAPDAMVQLEDLGGSLDLRAPVAQASVRLAAPGVLQ